MISIERPGRGNLEIEFILLDFEGTLAIDRRVHPKAKDKVNLLSKRTKIYVFVNLPAPPFNKCNPPTTPSKRVNSPIPPFNKGGTGGILSKELIEERLRKVKAEIIFLPEGDASGKKLDLLRRLGPARCAAIGNGVADGAMIEEAGIGICVIGKEGSSGQAVKSADLVFTDILDALDFLLKPLRQKAILSL
jgi:soluble P-type ATPase